MTVIVTENVPERIRGRLAVYMIEVRAGVFVGRPSRRLRELLWRTILSDTGEGNAVLAWSTNTEGGYDFLTCGPNRRNPVDFDGLRLVAFKPEPKAPPIEGGTHGGASLSQ